MSFGFVCDSSMVILDEMKYLIMMLSSSRIVEEWMNCFVSMMMSSMMVVFRVVVIMINRFGLMFNLEVKVVVFVDVEVDSIIRVMLRLVFDEIFSMYGLVKGLWKRVCIFSLDIFSVVLMSRVVMV